MIRKKEDKCASQQFQNPIKGLRKFPHFYATA
jgi:hypothetical protein